MHQWETKESELEKQVKPLEKQSETAKIYLKKKEELKEFVHEIEVEIHMTVDELMKYGYAE